ncbi:hypothetical protein [Pseudoalteromonas sp. Xi13]|uniref:hypothetical protein n=1 Tax=Pseudoalteromonas sp. Xi13 TaxID=2490635 RepID=UPI0013DF7609|nr:hypothetical protein [Pseudoalteromonas sp. Xi13]
MDSYKVTFKGQLTEGVERDKVGLSLAKFLKLPESKAELLFNGKTYIIKKGLNLEKAKLIQKKLKSVGVITNYSKEENKQPPNKLPEKTEKVSDVLPIDKDFAVEPIMNDKICKYCGSELVKADKNNFNLNLIIQILSNGGYLRHLGICFTLFLFLAIVGVFSSNISLGFWAWLSFIIVMPITVSIGSYIGGLFLKFVKPNLYFTSGVMDALQKRVFWTVGPQFIGGFIGYMIGNGFIINVLGFTQFL